MTPREMHHVPRASAPANHRRPAVKSTSSAGRRRPRFTARAAGPTRRTGSTRPTWWPRPDATRGAQ